MTQAARPVLAGRVTAPDGTPLAGARVSIRGGAAVDRSVWYADFVANV